MRVLSKPVLLHTTDYCLPVLLEGMHIATILASKDRVWPGEVWAAMEPFCSDFGQWPTVMFHTVRYLNLHVWCFCVWTLKCTSRLYNYGNLAWVVIVMCVWWLKISCTVVYAAFNWNCLLGILRLWKWIRLILWKHFECVWLRYLYIIIVLIHYYNILSTLYTVEPL